MERQFIRWL